MPINNYGGHTKDWETVGAKIPPEDVQRLKQRYPEKGQVSKVIRALLQMHLNNKIGRLEFTVTERM